MGVAYSPPDRVIHADIDASASHCLRQGLHRAVQLAGWEIHDTVENGCLYILTSPQDPALQMKVLIEDTGRIAYGFRPLIDVIFMDTAEEHLSSRYGLWYGPGRRIRAHITPCQIFTYVASTTGTSSVVSGGIPFIDPNALAATIVRCADEDNELKTWRAWWAVSDDSEGSFHTGWTAGIFAAHHNDEFISQTAHAYDNSRLRLLPVQRPEYFQPTMGNANFAYPLILRWRRTEEPLHLDPLIAWAGNHPVKIRGQLWDAVVRTKYVPWESPLLFEDLLWFSYSMGEAIGYPPHYYQQGDLFTLYLRDPGITYFECDEPEPEPEPGESNYAY